MFGENTLSTTAGTIQFRVLSWYMGADTICSKEKMRTFVLCFTSLSWQASEIAAQLWLFIHSIFGGRKLLSELPWGRLVEIRLQISGIGPFDHHHHSFTHCIYIYSTEAKWVKCLAHFWGSHAVLPSLSCPHIIHDVNEVF